MFYILNGLTMSNLALDSKTLECCTALDIPMEDVEVFILLIFQEPCHFASI